MKHELKMKVLAVNAKDHGRHGWGCVVLHGDEKEDRCELAIAKDENAHVMGKQPTLLSHWGRLVGQTVTVTIKS